MVPYSYDKENGKSANIISHITYNYIVHNRVIHLEVLTTKPLADREFQSI